eukprot:14295177-Ditylum_brightwellii.AAC.1
MERKVNVTADVTILVPDVQLAFMICSIFAVTGTPGSTTFPIAIAFIGTRGEPSNQDQGAVNLIGGKWANLGPECVVGRNRKGAVTITIQDKDINKKKRFA